MRPGFWQRMDGLARHMLPFTLTLLLLVVTVVPTHLEGLVRVGPALTLIAVYYWAVYRPDLMGYGSVFLIGVVEDLLAATPLGVGPLVLLMVYGAVISQNKFFLGKSFAVVWWAFGVVAAGAGILKWLAIAAVSDVLVEPTAPLFSILMTIGAYPVIAWVLARTQLAYLNEA